MNTLLCCGRRRTLLQKLEQLDETKKTGPSDVLSRKNDIQQNWKSFSELREEIYSQLQVQCTPSNAPVDKLLLSLRCGKGVILWIPALTVANVSVDMHSPHFP